MKNDKKKKKEENDWKAKKIKKGKNDGKKWK